MLEVPVVKEFHIDVGDFYVDIESFYQFRDFRIAYVVD
jgi:hypothetical protein